METDTENTIDLSYLKITFSDNNAIINKVLQSFTDSTPQHLEQLITSCSNRNWEDVKMVAHKMKSSYNTIGAKKAGELLAQIELEALNADQPNLSNLVNKIEELSQEVFKEVQLELNK